MWNKLFKAHETEESNEIIAISDIIGETQAEDETQAADETQEVSGTPLVESKTDAAKLRRISSVTIGSTASSISSYRERGWVRRQFEEPCGCPNHWAVHLTSAIVILITTWGVLYAVLQKEVAFDGGLFKLIVLILLAYLGGQLMGLIKLPPLVGMMIVGIFLRSIGFYTVSGVYIDVVSILRGLALTVILIKAGLGLEGAVLLRLTFVVLRLGIVPCAAEAIGNGIVAHFLLGYPWLWGLILGAMVSAVSPAVQVPPLLKLNEEGYGRKKGISTLCLAATGLDDVVAISLFGVFKSMLFVEGDITLQIIRGPLELLLGLASGIAWGFLSGCLPHRNDTMVVCARAVMIGFGGVCAIFGSSLLHVHGAGPLACITSAFTAGLCWKFQGWRSERSPVQNIFAKVWRVFSPILFGLIGAEIDLKVLEIVTVGYGLCVIAGGLFVRVIICCIVVLGANLNLKEIIFVNIAWIPKASVPAALGPIPLETVKKQPNPSEEDLLRGSQVLTFAVLSILVSAPLGAIGLALSGPRLLTKDPLPRKRRRKVKISQNEENK